MWIEIPLNLVRQSTRRLSLPSGEVWIEIPFCHNRQPPLFCHFPQGKCGLKFPGAGCCCQTIPSLPSGEVWIEIYKMVVIGNCETNVKLYPNNQKSRQGSMAGRRMQETGFYGNAIRQEDAPAKGNVWNGRLQAIRGFRLRIYLCLWILSATITVISCVIAAGSRSAWSVFSF